MSNNDKFPEESPQTGEQEIDLLELAKKVWTERRLIFKWCGIAVVAGLIVGFSIPREYTTNATLAPESGAITASGNMSTLAAMAGINLTTSNTSEALSPALYPDIVQSTPFLLELFDIPVADKKGERRMTVYTYLLDHQRAPWWKGITSAPFKLLGKATSLFSGDDKGKEGQEINPFMLTKNEANVAKALSDRISILVDKKTGVTTVSVSMQDPLISATLTDTVLVRLQGYITKYRTNKARYDLLFTEKIFEEAKENYFVAQDKLAKYLDSNLNIVMESRRAELTRLQNELNLMYGIYSQIAQQLEMARMKVQEITPVYTIVQPAVVPLVASKPRKAMILVGFVFLAGVIGVGWILFGRDFVENWKRK